MRKLSAFGLCAICGAIVVGGWKAGSQQIVTTPVSSPVSQNSSQPVTPSPISTTTSPSSSGSASASPSKQDGTFNGDVENTRYGTVQVSVTYSEGKITDVEALKLTDDGGRSVQISNQAAPILRSEVLSAQSANVASVSGATYTTEGYLTSLQSAIDKR